MQLARKRILGWATLSNLQNMQAHFGEKIIILARCLVRLASFRKCTDHSTADYKGYALKGFLNGGTHTLSEEERKAKVILQLTKLSFEAANYVDYHEKVWRRTTYLSLRASPTYGT
jgi:hypothetical protein